jgi:pyruvate dehydrogenase E2 component (dihydrolipoamide acetyltransferase)
MPRQGNTVESCVLVAWRTAEGAKLSAAEILCDVETDKAVFEVPAGFDGTVLKLLAAEGDDVPVLAPIAVIGEAGEDWAAAVPGSVPTGQPSSVPNEPSSSVPKPSSVPKGQAPGVSPRARELAFREAFNPAAVAGSGPGGRVLERDVRSALEARGPLSAAARAAAAGGAQVPQAGTGPGGRIMLADIEAAAKASAAAPIARATGAADSGFPGAFTETPIRSIRKVIADRMRESLATTAQFTLHASAPAGRLQELRARMKASQPSLGMGGVTVGDIVLFVASRVIKDHPNCNSLKVGDTVKTFERVHLGLAVDTPRGLMVPVIRNADLLSLRQISAEAKRLAAACVEGKASPDELSGSTFTVTNLGSLGVDYFTPVINAPEVCVLGVGAILPKPFAAPDGSYAIGPAIGLSLTSDHQVVDGAPAARFLKDLCTAMADADLWVAR